MALETTKYIIAEKHAKESVQMESIDWSLLAKCIGVASLAGLVVYHAVCGYYHYRYYVRRRIDPDAWKVQPERFPSPKMQRTAILSGTRNMILSGVLTGVLVYDVVNDGVKTAIYTDVSEYGWLYTLGMTVVLFMMMDWIAYWVHRALHIKFLFKHVHRFHHRFVAPSPWTAIALHPVELLVLQAASFLPLFFIPFHAVSIAGVLLYILIFNIIDHSGVKLVSALPWQPPSAYHDDHHHYFHVNYGQHLMIWDRLYGTLRRQNRRYGKEIFGGFGAPASKDGAQQDKLGPFVKY